MAYLDDLIARVNDPALRALLAEEAARLRSRTNFGIVFERHIPERVALPDRQPCPGARAVLRSDQSGAEYVVQSVEDDQARLEAGDGTTTTVAARELLVLHDLGEPLYPALRELGAVERAPGEPYHVVIEGENFHALQLLTFLLPRSVDCIYIDPPYNTGARDWKYNNRFVDNNDLWRHSKWLAMMERRLQVARRLLKPDGVLIVTIDQNELHHLGLLLEQHFPEAMRQVVTICINPSGASGGEGFSRVEEYAVFCFFGGAEPVPTADDMLVEEGQEGTETSQHGVRWERLMRGGNAWYRASRPNLCYPVLLNEDRTRILRTGRPYSGSEEERPLVIEGHPVAWPVRTDGKLGIWRVEAARLDWLVERGYAHVSSPPHKEHPTLRYLLSGTVDQLESGSLSVLARGERGQVIVQGGGSEEKRAKTVWKRGRHTAGGGGGTGLLSALLGERNLFPFPKSVYAVRDCLAVAVGDRQDAVILDFFAGSGTTLHATCLLNQDDGGQRSCLLVTNNEVDGETATRLAAEGLRPGDDRYEAHGIFRAVTRPRCEAAVTGIRSDGTPLPGRYIDGRALADGFPANVRFFALKYLDRDRVELGREFEAIAPALWLKAGAQGAWEMTPERSAPWSIPLGATYAVLFDETKINSFREQLETRPTVRQVYLVTDSQEAYAELCDRLGGRWPTSMLYRDYLRNFRVEPEQLL